MNNRLMTEEEKRIIRSMMVEAGFTEYDNNLLEEILLTGLHFYVEVSAEDKAKVVKNNLPSHFDPHGWRSVHVFTSYVTSNIRGNWRAYRGRKVYNSHDSGNIFAHSGNGNDNPVENTRLWLEKYAKLEYTCLQW